MNLKELIASEPANGARTDQEVLDWLNEQVNVPINSISGDDVFGATDAAEFGSLTDHKQLLWLSFCSRQTIDPFGAANVAFVQFIFGGGSLSISNLQALRNRQQPRWKANGFRDKDNASWLVHIAKARA